jgi:hypothetical protein
LSSPVPGKRDADDLEEDEETEAVVPTKRQKVVAPPAPKLDIRLLITGYKPWVNNLQKEDTDKVSASRRSITSHGFPRHVADFEIEEITRSRYQCCP